MMRKAYSGRCFGASASFKNEATALDAMEALQGHYLLGRKIDLRIVKIDHSFTSKISRPELGWGWYSSTTSDIAKLRSRGPPKISTDEAVKSVSERRVLSLWNLPPLAKNQMWKCQVEIYRLFHSYNVCAVSQYLHMESRHPNVTGNDAYIRFDTKDEAEAANRASQQLRFLGKRINVNISGKNWSEETIRKKILGNYDRSKWEPSGKAS